MSVVALTVYLFLPHRGSRQRLGRLVSPELAAGLEANGTRFLVRGAASDDLVFLAADPLRRHRVSHAWATCAGDLHGWVYLHRFRGWQWCGIRI
jgi:hypothetical protein